MKKTFNSIGAIVVLAGALLIIVPALMGVGDSAGNYCNLAGCIVMIAGFLLHIILNKRITTIAEK